MAKNQMMVLANRMAKAIVAEQTRARVMLGFDAAIIAANKALHMGPKRAQEFCCAYHEAMEWLANLYISDCDEHGDKKIDYAKGKRDEVIKKIVGDDNFVPFDRCYGEAYMDELKRIRVMDEAAKG